LTTVSIGSVSGRSTWTKNTSYAAYNNVIYKLSKDDESIPNFGNVGLLFHRELW